MSTITIATPNTVAERALQAIQKLPPFSPVLNKLIASLNDDDVSFAEIGALIERDTILAGNVLRLVNSALYARTGTISSVKHAVSILGLTRLRNFSLSMALARMWNGQKWPQGWNATEFNLHGVASAILTDLLVLELPVNYPEGGFTAGLLQNIGMQLIAVGMPEEFQAIREMYEQGVDSLHACERRLLDTDHQELSAKTLRLWRIPDPVVEAVEQHHGPHPPTPAGLSLGYVVEQAALMVEQQDILPQRWLRRPEGIPAEGLRALGLEGRADRIMGQFSSEFDTIRGFFSA